MTDSLLQGSERDGEPERSADSLPLDYLALDEAERADLESLLEHLKRVRGFDFTGYKRASLTRRIRKRMQAVGTERFTDYLDYLEVHPQEFPSLFNTILINVTTFFRDGPAWQYVAEHVVPRILESRPTGNLRVWNAGCASGQEAYTTAITMAEALTADVFCERVKIYATDIDEEALTQARHATYTPADVKDVDPVLRGRYFEPTGDRLSFRKDLRRCVIFGRHDLLQDAPISRVDLLVCRNTLMYFNAEAQNRILENFHFALRDEGFLFLGKAEMLFTHAELFKPVELKRRVFRKVPRADIRERLLVIAQSKREETVNSASDQAPLREAAFQSSAAAQVVVDLTGTIIVVNKQARLLFGLSQQDAGRPLQDLEISYRPVELRSLIEQAHRERRTVELADVPWTTGSDPVRYLDVEVVPLRQPGGPALGTSLLFSNVTTTKKLREDLQHSNQALETAYEELQSTNEELQTTNEELQSTIEELETTNEELHSTNEELETMNEELQSTNEELQTMNEELRQRGDELNEVNAWLDSILSSLSSAVVVVLPDFRIQAWNRAAEELWGLRADEVSGHHLMTLDIGLQVEKLKPLVKACTSEEATPEPLRLEAVNRRGKRIVCEVSCMQLRGADGAVRGAILMMQDGAVPPGPSPAA